MIQRLRSLLISILALWKGLSQKEIGKRAGIPSTNVSYHLRKGKLEEEVYECLLRGVEARPAEEAVVTHCLESLERMRADLLTPEERDAVELGVLDVARLAREALTEAALASRHLPPAGGYPQPSELEPARWHAGLLWKRLEPLSDGERLAVVRFSPTFQTWALVERLCEESVVQASRDLERSAALARLAHEVADRVAGPEEWRLRVQGFAAAHVANALRVAGKLKASDARMEEAKRLWHAGSDPDAVLDPGRLLDLEASLRRDQRRFEEALELLDRATSVSRCPAHTWISMGFTLELMGEYERAVAVLREAESLPASAGDPRVRYMLQFNLAVNFTHLGRYGDAFELVQQVRNAAADLGDELFLLRVVWLEGRIAAGLGASKEAQSLLALARQGFVANGMGYDLALALLEEATLLLAEGRAATVKALASELAHTFEGEGVHKEARVALKLFQEAAEREAATAELARRVLEFLFRARNDPGLRFNL